MTKMISSVCLTCDDWLPLSEVKARGEHFTLTWREYDKAGALHLGSMRLGAQARELVGLEGSDPRIIRLIVGDQPYCTVGGLEVDTPVEMTGVREYAEEMPVMLRQKHGRWVVVARNEGGLNNTEVDLEDLLGWVYRNRPDLWERTL